MRPMLAPLVPVVLLAACGGGGEPQSPPVETPSLKASPTPDASPQAVATPQADSVTKVENDLFEFGFEYPAAAAAIPGLRAWLETNKAKALQGIREETRGAKQDAEADGYEYRPYGWSSEWKLVTELPGWLSLSVTDWSYTGGAHGNYGFGSLLWDKATDRPREVLDLFVSKQALSAAIRAPFCDALDKQRAEKREEPVRRDDEDWMSACIDPVEQAVLLGSSDRKAFNRIGILVGPYAAGPYAEGAYEVTLPVNPAVLAAVKPEYRGSFAKAP